MKKVFVIFYPRAENEAFFCFVFKRNKRFKRLIRIKKDLWRLQTE